MSVETPRQSAHEEPRALVIGPLPHPFGKFMLRRRLARGGMADVYLASMSGAQGFEKELVVKLIRQELAADEAFVRRFVEEAKTCVRLTHPNIVSIFELGVEAGILYMAMELIRGATLAELLASGGALRPDEGAYVALELARALDHAHRRGVVHRDVTPGNVMLDDDGAVKLLDFGIAAPVGGLDVEAFGTPGHMPPEQMAGRVLAPSADLFALGTVMVEAWTGRAPYRRADARASKTALLEGEPATVSATVPELAPLDDLVRASLDRDPSHRPQHAEDVARVLRQFLRERNVDLDEVARAMSRRVGKALAAHEARERGEAVPSAPMPQAMRPTPFAEATRTFATRSELDAWRAPDEATSTRRIEGTQPHPSTRRMVDDEEAQEPEVQAKLAPAVPAKDPRRRGLPLLIVLTLAGASAVAIVATRGRPPVTPSGSASTTTTQTQPSLPFATSGSGTSSTVGSAVSSTPSTPSTTTSVSASTSSTTQAQARLVVTSSPPSTVEIDGHPMGPTPLSTSVAPGEHRVVLRPQGLGESFERRVTVTATAGVEVRGDFNDEPSISVRKMAGTAPSR
jgi:serine/threonine protein kinase